MMIDGIIFANLEDKRYKFQTANYVSYLFQVFLHFSFAFTFVYL